MYLVPFIVPAAYGLFLWVQAGISAILPTSVFLTVTRDPYVFIIGSGAVMLGLMVEVNGTEQSGRFAKLSSVGNNLQSMAVASLILVIGSAWYANGFTDIYGMSNDLLIGRYGLVFPAVLVLLSYLTTAKFNIASLSNRQVLAIIAMLLVPVSLYEIGKREITLGLLAALLFLGVGLGLYLVPERKPKTTEE